ncbi:MAG TPA: glycosyltransferase [Bryobacteraceae bacterium]|nr:glycosyltransferase [Bryobacteraceae bacterium]
MRSHPGGQGWTLPWLRPDSGGYRDFDQRRLDDLALDVVCFWAWIKRRLTRNGDDAGFASQPDREKLIAIFVPLWHEHSFTAGMVEHNVSAINYGNYHVFIGAYPNDDPTLDAVRELEQRFPHVHLAVCPHHGPTSKADCLNWVYRRMLLFEAHHGEQFEIVMTHDAEDLIHPESLA